MIAQLEESGVDIVAASAHHPQGGIEGIPAWRLALSRGASVIYGWILPVKLYGYTGCMRAFRRQAVERLEFREPGFLGVTEMLVHALLDGMTVIEYPTVLRIRTTGVSKMNSARVLRDHVGFMLGIILRRRPKAA